MTEVWKAVIGYEGLYEVSSIGRLRSLPKKWISGTGRVCSHDGIIMSLAKSPEGYPQARIRNKKSAQTHRIHRLVADAFIPNPLQYKCVNHIDSNRHNNSVENLEWSSYSMNRTHAFDIGFAYRGEKNPQSKLKDSEIISIAYENESKRNKDLALQYGVSQSLISLIRNKKYKRMKNLINT